MKSIEQAVKERYQLVKAEMEHLEHLLDVYGTPSANGQFGTDEVSKSDLYKHELRRMMKELKSFHVNDMKEEFDAKGIEWNKGILHQALQALRDSGEIIAIKINGSNQKYYYMSADAKIGGKYAVKDHYLPMSKEYIDTVELIESS